jgi:hypothetical protein
VLSLAIKWSESLPLCVFGKIFQMLVALLICIFTTSNLVEAANNAELLALKSKYFEIYNLILKSETPPLGKWVSDTGCAPFSLQLCKAFKQNGLSVKRVKVDNNTVVLVGDKIESRHAYHFYLVDDSLGSENELIIDPTYLQFIGDRSVSIGDRDVFIGDRQDLVEQIETHSYTGYGIPGNSVIVEFEYGLDLSAPAREEVGCP